MHIKNILLFLLVILIRQSLISQILDTSNYKYYAPNGGIFTPKGNLKALLVFVHFKDNAVANPEFKNSQQYLKNWDFNELNANHLPQIVDAKTGKCPSIIFTDLEDFEKSINDTVYNYSKDFYYSSLGNFRFYGEVFKDSMNNAISVEIDATGTMSWGQCNKKAFEEMKKINPNMDYSSFDNRKNSPLFAFDNTDTINYPKDKILDYVIFIYRYSRNWSQHPVPNMQHWPGSGGGVATTGLGMDKTQDAHTIREGFTMNFNGGVFIHEVAHTLYNIPHLFGANHVSGEYFYIPNVGWGATSMISIFRGGLTAWERWYLGYIDFLADLKMPSIAAQDSVYEYILQDYQSTGDALRIELPFTKNQQLYIENHTGEHSFDNHIWTYSRMGTDTLAQTARGVYMYVSELPNLRTSIVQALSNKANSIRLLNANGNYDYSLKNEMPEKNAWNNDVYLWQRMQENPLNGLNPYYVYPIDKNKDGVISIDKNYNQARYEGAMILREYIDEITTVDLYAGFGSYNEDLLKKIGYTSYYRNPAFQDGDILGMGTNPTIVNHATYNTAKANMQPFIINGLQVKINKIANTTAVKIQVKFAQTTLLKSTNWAGNIYLPNITQDEKYDLIIPKNKTLYLVSSKTPNRHTKGENNDFINPSVLRIAQDAKIYIQSKGELRLKENTTLILEKGSSVFVDKKAKLILEKNAKIILEENAEIILHHKAKSNYKL